MFDVRHSSSEVAKPLPAEERKRLAAFMVALRHRELAEYRTTMARMIDDRNPENWATLEELDQRLES